MLEQKQQIAWEVEEERLLWLQSSQYGVVGVVVMKVTHRKTSGMCFVRLVPAIFALSASLLSNVRRACIVVVSTSVADPFSYFIAEAANCLYSKKTAVSM